MKIGNDWDELLQPEFKKNYYLKLTEFLLHEYQNHTVYPDKYDIFNALKYTGYSQTKVVLLGQDPYHGPKQAHGLSFSVKPGMYIPPSLQNIYKELEDDLEFMPPNHGCLIEWAEQGVLLLNTVLTVRKSTPNSHKGKGWEIFTDKIIEHLNNRDEPVIFLLWGKNAQCKQDLISSRHFVYTASHPSPYSASSGFFGSNHFSAVNKTLKMIGKEPIDWQLSEKILLSK